MPSYTPQNWIIQACVDGYYLQNNKDLVFETHFYPYHHKNVNVSYLFRNYGNTKTPYKHYHPCQPLYLCHYIKHYICSIIPTIEY